VLDGARSGIGKNKVVFGVGGRLVGWRSKLVLERAEFRKDVILGCGDVERTGSRKGFDPRRARMG